MGKLFFGRDRKEYLMYKWWYIFAAFTFFIATFVFVMITHLLSIMMYIIAFFVLASGGLFSFVEYTKERNNEQQRKKHFLSFMIKDRSIYMFTIISIAIVFYGSRFNVEKQIFRNAIDFLLFISYLLFFVLTLILDVVLLHTIRSKIRD